MQSSERPLGLSVIAVVCLGFGLINSLSLMYLVLTLLTRVGAIQTPGLDPSIAQAYAALPVWFLGFLVATTVIKIGLLVAAGIFCLQLKRLGRILGSGYALVSILESVVALVALPYGLTREAVIGVLFAVYVLAALNTMYKPLLTR